LMGFGLWRVAGMGRSSSTVGERSRVLRASVERQRGTDSGLVCMSMWYAGGSAQHTGMKKGAEGEK
jgi:hypothetical protein